MNKPSSQYMLRALELAKKGLYTTFPNPRVGCVIVNQQQIVGEGWHQRAGEAHAEIMALEMAGERAKGATLYVTMEPCAHYGRTPPCCNAIIAAGITKVVCATLDPSAKNNGKGLAMLSAQGIATIADICANEAVELNPGFFSISQRKRPWIRIKLAMSLDGRTALHSGESQWISSEASRRDVQFQRARMTALLTGSGTVIHDNPRLNVRLAADAFGIEGNVRQPLRIVLDSRLQTSPDAAIYHPNNQALLVTGSTDIHRIRTFEKHGVEILKLPLHGGHIPLRLLFEELASREIGEIQVEAGERFAGALITEKLYDELLLYVAPILLGDGKSLAVLPKIQSMAQKHSLTWHDVAKIGDDLRVTLRPVGIQYTL